MKPLFDEKLAGLEVQCLDISEDGFYIIAGYETGLIALWDI